MLVLKLKRLKKENDFDVFYKKISTFIPSLKNFTNAKLNIIENQGLIEKKFYNANDILDEIYLEIYNKIIDIIDEKTLKQFLFIKTIQKINEKAKIEQQFSNAISIETILQEELSLLNEKYTIGADGNFILNDELDDISYKQKKFKPTHFILDDNLALQVFNRLNLDYNTFIANKGKRIITTRYYNLPPKSKIIAELYIFGNQSVSEIADILMVKKEKIDAIITKITKIFKL